MLPGTHKGCHYMSFLCGKAYMLPGTHKGYHYMSFLCGERCSGTPCGYQVNSLVLFPNYSIKMGNRTLVGGTKVEF